MGTVDQSVRTDRAQRVRRHVALAGAAAALLAAAPSGAQTTTGDTALAETLFREAKALMAERRFEAACPKLAESQRLDPGTGTLMALALCHEGEGKTASAWAEYIDAETASRRDGRADRERFAHEHSAALEPTLSRLTVVVREPIDGLVVKRDGAVLAQVAWGTAAPVDPGPHVIEASAPGKSPWRGTASVGSPAARVELVVPRLQDAPPGAPAAAAATAPAPEEGNGARRSAGLVVGAVGLVAIGVGAVFGVTAIAKSHDAKARCSPASCTDAGAVDLNDEAKRAATIANVGIGVGLAAIAVGAFLVLTARPAKRAAALELSPRWVGLGASF